MDIKRNLFKKLGNTLITEGEVMLRKAFGVKPKIIYKSVIIQLLKSKGITKVYGADGRYQYLDIDTVEDIILYDLTDKIKYLAEFFDCDDFADTVSVSFKKIYHVSTVGVAKHIQMVDPDTGEHIEWHRANVIIADDKGELGAYFLEPQTDKIIKIEKDRKYNFYGKYYLINTIEF